MNLPYTFAEQRAEIERNRDNVVFVPESGLPMNQLIVGFDAIAAQNKPRVLLKAELLAYLFDNAQLEFSPVSLFVDRINHGCKLQHLRQRWASEAYAAIDPAVMDGTGNDHGAWSGDDDFGHTCPDWESIYSLGLPGLLKRAEDAAAARQ